MDEWYDYCADFELTKAIMVEHKKFRDIAIGYLNYNPDDLSEDSNCVRSCQYCGEIWVKVSGCDGNTKCGEVDSRPDYVSEHKKKGNFELLWRRFDGKFIWKKERKQI